MTAALALAFSAGLVSTLNPCGFAMLPAYLSYFMGFQDDGRERGGSAVVRSALAVGLVVSAGFLVVFGLAGVAIAWVSRTVATQWIPWLALAVGAGVGVLGLAMLFGYSPVIGGVKAKRGRVGGGYGNVLLFGTSYALASLSCTLPVFLSVVATQITARSLGAGVAIFAAYAAGMAVMLLGITLVLALGKQSIVRRLRVSGKYITRISGVIMVAAGVWIVWFWATAIANGSAALGGSGTFRVIENVSQTLLNFVADNTLLVSLSLVGIIGVALVYAWRAGRRPDRTGVSGSVAGTDSAEKVGSAGGGIAT